MCGFLNTEPLVKRTKTKKSIIFRWLITFYCNESSYTTHLYQLKQLSLSFKNSTVTKHSDLFVHLLMNEVFLWYIHLVKLFLKQSANKARRLTVGHFDLSVNNFKTLWCVLMYFTYLESLARPVAQLQGRKKREYKTPTLRVQCLLNSSCLLSVAVSSDKCRNWHWMFPVLIIKRALLRRAWMLKLKNTSALFKQMCACIETHKSKTKNARRRKS